MNIGIIILLKGMTESKAQGPGKFICMMTEEVTYFTKIIRVIGISAVTHNRWFDFKPCIIHTANPYNGVLWTSLLPELILIRWNSMFKQTANKAPKPRLTGPLWGVSTSSQRADDFDYISSAAGHANSIHCDNIMQCTPLWSRIVLYRKKSVTVNLC